MLRIKPFPAVRPQANLAARVASVPYDVVNTDEARALAAGNPLSFLHVTRPEIDLPDGTGPYDDIVYETARANFQSLRAQALLQDPEPSLYLYRQVMDHQQQTGIVCCCHVDDYTNNVIRRHEHTRRSKEDDRTRHMNALNAQPGPVLLTYRDDPELARMIDRDRNQRPLYHFDAPDGVTHTLWHVSNSAAFVDAFARIPCAYVADGHHRSASAARVADERRAANPNHDGNEPYNWFLSVLFPASELHILAYNRLILEDDRSPDEILDALRATGTVSPTSDPVPGGDPATPCFCVYIGGAWYRVELDPSSVDHRDPVASLDVTLLHDRIIEPVFGITDVRSDPRIDFVGGIRGTGALEQRVDSGEAVMAISMRPTSIEQLLSVADAGHIMPPKSTWFEPKLRSGLFVHCLS